MSEVLAHINDDDEVLAKVDRRRIHRLGLLHREVDILVLNHHGLLMQQRADTHKWCHFGGHVEYGESLKHAAIREFLEETRYRLPSRYVTRVSQYRRCTSRGPKTNNRLTTVFLTLLPIRIDDLTPQPSEIERIAYFSQRDLRRLMRDKTEIMAGTTFLLKHVSFKIFDCVPLS